MFLPLTAVPSEVCNSLKPLKGEGSAEGREVLCKLLSTNFILREYVYSVGEGHSKLDISFTLDFEIAFTRLVHMHSYIYIFFQEITYLLC